MNFISTEKNDFAPNSENLNEEVSMNEVLITEQSSSDYSFSPMDDIERQRLRNAYTTFLTAEESQKRLNKILDDFVSGEVTDAIIKAEAGLGKSTAVIEKVLTEGKLTFYFVPTHQLGNELNEKIKKEKPNLRGYVFWGRDNDGMCQNRQQCNKLRENGSSVADGCLKCEHFENCAYIDQIKNIPSSDYIILPHNYLVLPFAKSLLEKLDIEIEPNMLVIDEAFWSTFLDMDKKVTLRQLKNYRSLIKKLSLKDKRRSQMAKIVIDAIIDSVQNEKPMLKTLRDKGVDYKALKSAQKSFNNSVFKPKKNNTLVKQFQKFRKSNIGDLLRCLSSEIDRDRIKPNQVVANEKNSGIHHLYFKKNCAFDKYDEYGNNVGCDIPTLVIDADADKMIIDRLIGKKKSFKFYPIRTKRQSHITQIKNKSFFTSGLVEGGMNEKDIKPINDFIKEKSKTKKVVCISPKKIEELICHNDTEHFGNIRGIDKYKDYDCLVLVGRNQPSVLGVENICRALFGNTKRGINFINKSNDGRFMSFKENYKMKSGERSKRTSTKVPSHLDSRCQSILNQIRENESTQSISRLRDIWKGNKEVYIFSNVVLDIEIDELVNWSDFINGSKMDKLFDRIDIENEVFPITDAEYMSQQNSDLFPNSDSYKNELKKFKLNSNGKDLKTFYREIEPSLTEFKFKLPNKRFWSSALSPFEIEKTKRNLNKMYSTDVQIKELIDVEKVA
jgi:hypothetical protein